MVRDDFLAAARSAAELLRAPEVAAAWDGPSALADFTVSGLAGHLAYQVLGVRQALADPVPEEETVTLLGHYARVEWIGSAPDDPVNVRIRDGGEQVAAEGAAALAGALDATVAELARTLAVVPERAVRIGLWGPWSLSLADFLRTRMMELAVHSDDLAVSVGVATPVLPDAVMETVIDLLARLAVRRHGGTEVLRALSRAERAPGSIAAF